MLQQMDTKTIDTCTFEDLLKPTNTPFQRSVLAVGVSPEWLVEHGYQIEGDVALWGEFPATAEALPMPVARMPLGATVLIPKLGVEGVVSGHAANDRRVRVSWFNRHFWRVDHKWVDEDAVEALENKTAASA